MTRQSIPANSEIRHELSMMTDVEFEAWFQDNYSSLNLSFSPGMSRAARVNALIDLCIRRPEERERLGKVLSARTRHSSTLSQTTTPSIIPSQLAHNREPVNLEIVQTKKYVLPIYLNVLLILLGAISASFLLYVYWRAFTCILTDRLTDAISALLIALVSAVIVGLIRLLPPRAREIIYLLLMGVGMVFVGAVLIALTMLETSGVQCRT
jgi:hypothetical protein